MCSKTSGGSIGRTFFFSLIIFLISVAESSIIGAFILQMFSCVITSLSVLCAKTRG